MPAESEADRDWRLVFGGLSLLLSRMTDQEIARDMRHGARLHAALRCPDHHADLGDAYLISEVMHEIARIADPATREALRRRFQCVVARREKTARSE